MTAPQISEAGVNAIHAVGALFRVRVALVGAAALSFWIDLPRSTADIDLALAIDIDDLTRIETELRWNRVSPHRFRAEGGTLLDVIPCSSSLLDAGELHWPNSQNIFNLTGLDLALSQASAIEAYGHSVPVAPVPVLVLLKMAAWLDRPERERDLGDIAHALDKYLGDDSDRRWIEFLDSGHPFERVSAFAVGYDLSALLRSSHRRVVDDFLHRTADKPVNLSLMARLAPPSWRNRPDVAEAQLQAMLEGIERRGSASED